MNTVRPVSVLALVLTLCLLSAACGGDSESEAGTTPAAIPDQLIGQQLPEASGDDLAGSGTLKLSSLRANSPMVVVFWLSVCPDCKAEMPRLQAAADRVKTARFTSVAIDDTSGNGGDAHKDARAFADAADLTMPTILVPRAEADAAFNLYRIPTVILVDSSGVVSKTFVWPFTTAEVEAAAAALR